MAEAPPLLVPPAWMVLDSRGRASLYLDHGRALQAAADHHGQLIPLVPAFIPLESPPCES